MTLLGWEGTVTTDLAESNSSLPPSGWLKVTCWLTACTPDQLRAQRSVTSMGELNHFYLPNTDTAAYRLRQTDTLLIL